MSELLATRTPRQMQAVQGLVSGLNSALSETAVALSQTKQTLDSSAELATFVRRRLGARKELRQQRRQQRRQRQRIVEDGSAAAPPAARSNLLLVLGVISNPRTPHTREWIRKSYFTSAADAANAGTVLLRFVVGKRGLNTDDERKLQAEHAAHSDLEYIDASDFAVRGGIFSCIDKLFAWFPHAAGRWPNARFYAKADDDSYVDVPRLLGMLRPLSSTPNAYLGYVQYDSLITDEWKHCGWSAGPVGAAHAFTHGCPHDSNRAVGPFPFVVGALTVLGGDLAQWMRGSEYIRSLVASGRASQSHPVKHWDCGYSDVTLGYALATSNQTVSLVSVRDAMRDATYGAMKGAHFIVAHHLRQEAQFIKAHAEALGAGEWTARLAEPCTQWPKVGSTRRAGAASGGTDDHGSLYTRTDQRELKKAMRAFGCCQQWQMCEVWPQAV